MDDHMFVVIEAHRLGPRPVGAELNVIRETAVYRNLQRVIVRAGGSLDHVDIVVADVGTQEGGRKRHPRVSRVCVLRVEVGAQRDVADGAAPHQEAAESSYVANIQYSPKS